MTYDCRKLAIFVLLRRNQLPLKKRLMDSKKEQVLKHIYDFFVSSADFNGIPLRQIGRELNIPYEESIDIVKDLVAEDKCMIQSSTNPHIIRLTTYTIPSQLDCLKDAKGWKKKATNWKHCL